MVSVYFGFDDSVNLFVCYYFNNSYNPEWFDDPFVKEMVEDVDNVVIESRYCLRSQDLGQIPPQLLSDSAKGLILLYEVDGFYTDTSIFSEKCQKWLSKLFEMKDIRITSGNNRLSFQGYPIHGICENDGSIINNSDDWERKQAEMSCRPENERWTKGIS